MTEKQAYATWQQYGRCLIAAMRQVLEEADDGHRDLLLETADYWLSLGLVIGLERFDDAEHLLGVLQGQTSERAELLLDADDFLAEAVR